MGSKQVEFRRYDGGGNMSSTVTHNVLDEMRRGRLSKKQIRSERKGALKRANQENAAQVANDRPYDPDTASHLYATPSPLTDRLRTY